MTEPIYILANSLSDLEDQIKNLPVNRGDDPPKLVLQIWSASEEIFLKLYLYIIQKRFILSSLTIEHFYTNHCESESFIALLKILDPDVFQYLNLNLELNEDISYNGPIEGKNLILDYLKKTQFTKWTAFPVRTMKGYRYLKQPDFISRNIKSISEYRTDPKKKRNISGTNKQNLF